MNPISEKLKKELKADPFYRSCCFCQASPVQWHHCFIYSGKQINEKYAILPVCEDHHQDDFFEMLKWISISLMDLEYMSEKYPKFNWYAEKHRLVSVYGEYKKQGESNGKK